MSTRPNYRKLAYKTYPPICAYCGFGVPEVLEVAHLEGDRANNAMENLAILCPNCHKMHDIDLIPTAPGRPQPQAPGTGFPSRHKMERNHAVLRKQI